MIITNPIMINAFVTSTERYLWNALLYIVLIKWSPVISGFGGTQNDIGSLEGFY
jgi:hypothetical protein